MATVNLSNVGSSLETDKESIVIVENFESIRGGRSLDVTGFTPKIIPAGHVIIKETATGEYKPMPASDSSDDGVDTFGTIVPGTGYTNGVYENVPLIGGTGSGALATVTVAGGVVTEVALTKPGDGYTPGDSLLIMGAYAGGTQTTQASIPVALTVDDTGSYGALPSGHTYAGINVANILTAKPFAGIMVRGTVNPAATTYDLSSILTDVKDALPLILFRED